MRYRSSLLILLIGLLSTPGLGQSVNFEDGFEDGDFANNPTWSGDTGEFIVVDGTPNFLLQLQGDSENGGTSYLSTPSSNTVGSWEFYINLDFSPSGGNRADIFLMSNIPNLEGSVNGYALRAGESGSNDVFKIVRYDGGSEATTVLSGTTDISSGGAFRVNVMRQTGGDWALEVAEGYDGILTQEGGMQTDNTYSTSSFFGIRSTYTSSRFDAFLFDFKIDLPPFTTTIATLSGNNSIDVGFNRAVDQSTVTPADFTVDNQVGSPNTVTFPAADTVRLNYSQVLSSNKYVLSVDGISDLSGNQIQAGSAVKFIVYDSYADGDVKINEFAYDYPIGQTEYVELVNTSNKYLNLSDWTIGDDTGTDHMGSETITLEANSFLVITEDTTALFNVYGHRDYHEISQLAAFNNSGGDAVQLRTDSGILADSLFYTGDWGGTDVALERRTTSAPAIYKENWGNSPNPNGGTPGLPNEVSQDNAPPQLTDLQILSDQSLELAFDERLETGSATNSANYSINGPGISSVTAINPDSIELWLDSGLQNAQEYTLTVSGIEDIFANAIPSFDTTFTYYKVSPVDSGDVAINEFMFAPPESIPEYIELYNHSTKSLDLNGWTLRDNSGDPATITDSQFIVPPDSFVVIAPDNTLLSTYPDIALVTMTEFPALNNGGDQIIIRNESGILLDSLQFKSEWGDEEVAVERRSITIPGTYQNNWGSAPNVTGTPGFANNIDPDTNPPVLESLTIAGSRQITIKFSEQLDKSTAGNNANYNISDGLGISDASFSAPDTVFLTLGNDLQNASDYTFNVQNVTDIFGNALNSADTSFTFYKTSPVDSGNIFINEFNIEPASGSTEYIEIYNPSEKSFNLQKWTLSDNRGNPEIITDSQFIIPPDSFVVIAPDNTLLTDYPDIALIPMGSNFPALNNSGDDIVIRDPDGVILDSLRYNSEWGGDQVALERHSVDASATILQNWGDAPNGFGTPGTENEIEPDNTPPFFTELFATDASTIQLVFSEAITPSSATNPSNYEISPQRGIQLVLANKDSVILSLDEPLTDGEIYQVTASNLSDLLGNSLSGATKEFEFVKIANGQPSDIVINEILHTPDDNQAEFVELYNSSDKNIDLNGWMIGDERSTTSIDQKAQLFPNEYLVITADNNFAAQIENAIVVSGLPALNGDSDAVFIQNPNEITIDSLYYTSTWGGNADGRSLARKDPLAASNDASNWKISTSEAGYSLGSQNAVFQPDSTPPEVIFSKVLPDNNIEVRFSEFIQLTGDVRFLSGGQQLNIILFDPDNANSVILEPPAAKTKKAGTIITVENLVDVKGNSTATSEVPVAQPLQASELVINEIMYNPLDEPDDNHADQSEYLELRNTQDYAISLEGLVLHDSPDEDGNLRQLQPVSTTTKWVPAQGHVLVYASQVAGFDQSQIAKFFELKSPENRSLMRVDRSSLSMASSGDAIFIADSTGTTIDSVFYDESWQNPNIIDPTGVALERISPDGPSDDESNWGSSVHNKGGTPNSENSIYQENPKTQQETGISFSPNPFSPDGDGHEDNLFINYKLDQQDYLIRVRIYDRYGRLVHELADGKQAGFGGQLIWDGRKDDGSRNRIGIYIVVFEAFDSAAGENRSFKETVVLARKLN